MLARAKAVEHCAGCDCQTTSRQCCPTGIGEMLARETCLMFGSAGFGLLSPDGAADAVDLLLPEMGTDAVASAKHAQNLPDGLSHGL